MVEENCITLLPNKVLLTAIVFIFVYFLTYLVNIVPNITSVYSWEGKVCEDNELLLIMKIPNDQLEAAQKAVKDLHSYDTPEFIRYGKYTFYLIRAFL